MKKLILTIAIVLASVAQGSLFNRDGNDQEEMRDNRGFGPNLPGHGETDDQNAPIGSGALLLIGFGAAYAMTKKSKK